MTEHHDLESELQVSLHVNDQLRARIAELEAALKPFAYDYGDYSDGMWSDSDYIEVLVSDLRAARAAYIGEKE